MRLNSTSALSLEWRDATALNVDADSQRGSKTASEQGDSAHTMQCMSSGERSLTSSKRSVVGTMYGASGAYISQNLRGRAGGGGVSRCLDGLGVKDRERQRAAHKSKALIAKAWNSALSLLWRFLPPSGGVNPSESPTV